MSAPNFLHIQSDGGIWFSLDENFVPPTGTSLAILRVYPEAKSQKIATLTGNSGSYACSGSTGRHGEIKPEIT
jgi:hypothetical protein